MNYPRKLPPLAALRAFEAAARRLSFRGAAAELAVTPTAISHQIRLLEEVLGQPLFLRHTRRVSLTPAGERLYPVLREGLDGFAEAIGGLSRRSERRAITITAPTLFTARKLVPALAAFREGWPEFELRLHATDAVVDLAAGEADIAVRYGSGPFPGLEVELLCRERCGILCSPAFGLTRPEDLRGVTLIHSEWHRPDLQPTWARWAALAGLDGTDGLDTSAGPRFSEESHAIQAAIAGHGVAIGSLVMFADELARGVLVNPFGPVIEGKGHHILATPQSMHAPPVAAVRDWLRQEVQS